MGCKKSGEIREKILRSHPVKWLQNFLIPPMQEIWNFVIPPSLAPYYEHMKFWYPPKIGNRILGSPPHGFLLIVPPAKVNGHPLRTRRYLYRHRQHLVQPPMTKTNKSEAGFQYRLSANIIIWNPLIWKYRHISKNVISAHPYCTY